MTYRLIGSSSNGLVCLNSNDNRLALFNPSTRLFKLVPDDNYSFHTSQLYGFGYDHRADDYKIVRVSYGKFMVYSLRTDSWRILKHSSRLPHGFGVLVNNRFHWKLENHDIVRLLSFDLQDEEWSEVPMPNLSKASINVYSLSLLDGCLCVLSSALSDDPTQGYSDIWMMREYGVKESWTKAYSFPYIGVKPLGSCSEDGREILFSKGYDDGLFIWNSELKMMREIDGPQIHYIPMVKCVESLTKRGRKP